jgi:hypothetical protein
MGGKPKAAKSTTNSTENVDRTTTVTPYGPAQGQLDAMLTAAQGAYNATPKTPVFTGPNATQQSAVDYLRGQAAGTATGGTQLRDLGVAQIRGDYLNPATNPYLTGAISAAVDPFRRELDQNILSVGDAATAAGAYGGDRSALLKARALTGFNREALNTSATMTAQNYANERQIQQNSGGLLDQANQLMLKPGQVLSTIGDQQQSWDMARVAALQEAPWTGLDRWASILGQAQPYSTQHTVGTDVTNSQSTGTPARPSGASSVMGGALGGASAGASFGPWGAAIGGVIGGLGGLFG